MMEVTIRLFATLRQQAGWSTKQITVADGATVDDVLQQLEELLPGVNIGSRTLYAAVNQGYAKRESVLQDGDEVAFFPPVSGGA